MIAQVAGLFSGDAVRARALRGTVLTIGAYGASNVIRLASNLVLTRLLFPEAFGLMALVQVVMTGLAMFSDTGLNLSIMQNRRGLEPVFLRTAWSVQIGRGVLLWVATVALAAPVAAFYDLPILAWMLPVVGLTSVIGGFGSTKTATANRQMLLGRITAISLGSQVTTILATVALAWALESVWALVWGTLIGSTLGMVLSHVAMPGQADRMGWDRTVFGELFRFGKWIFVASIAGFLVNTADRMILGRFIDVGTLGVYNIGYFLAMVPLALARQVDGRVLMPIFVRAVDDAPAVARRKIRRTRVLVAGGAIGLGLGLAVMGERVIALLYDPQYTLAGPILVLLALSYAVVTIPASYNTMMLAHGRSRDFTLYVVVLAAIQTPLMLYGVVHHGLIGALVAPGLSIVLVYPLTARLAARRGVWDPAVDAGLAALVAAGAAVALWANPGAVAAVLAAGGG